MDYESRLWTIYGVCVALVVISAFWVVVVLIQIELTKAMWFEHKLELSEEDDDNNADDDDRSSAAPQTHVALDDPAEEKKEDELESKEEQTHQAVRRKRVSWTFKIIQVATVSALVLLNYLLLVMTSAPIWLATFGMILVLAVFLRFQIGEELRRNRVDRIMLIFTLFLFMAGLLSLATYASKTQKQGEIYEGPARIIGYNTSQYENKHNDPVTRTNLRVEFGKFWACPLSGGKVCETFVDGVLCQATNDEDGDDVRRILASSSSPASNSTTGTNTTKTLDQLEAENEELQEQNEQLQSELDEMQEDVDNLTNEEAAVEEQAQDEIDSAYEEAEDAEEDAYQEEINEEQKAEEKEEEEIEEDEDEIDEWEQEDIEYIESYDESENVTASQEEADIEATEEAYEEYEEEVIDEVEDEYALYDDDYAWVYGDYTTYIYEDDYYEDAYWDYDWDSAWGEYGCEDLFDQDVMGQYHDASEKPGDDDWPTINIYGSCKTCEAYILDYFAEEAFEEVEFYKTQAYLHFVGAAIGMGFTIVFHIKHRVMPTAENEVELLPYDGGALA